MNQDIKLLVAIPTAGTCKMSFAGSLAGMISHVAMMGVPTRPEAKISLKLDIVESSNWITNRELLVKHALEFEMTHLMFLDDDMVFAPQVLEIMLGRRQPIVVTNYLIKTPECDSFVALGLEDKRLPTFEHSTGLVPIQYSGFGVSLFEMEVFKKVPAPRFQPEFIPELGSYTTEDSPFFRKAREAGFDVYLDQDASKLVKHSGNRVWEYKDYREPKNDPAGN